VDLREVVTGLYLLPLGISNAYLWRGSAGVTLIDTGPPGSAPAIEGAFEYLGIAKQELQRIVITHFHDDHAGSAAAVAAWSGAQVVAGAADADFIRGLRPGPPPAFTPAEQQLHALVASDLQAAPPCPVEGELADQATLDLDGEARVFLVPGHTSGSIAIHLSASGVLIAGDTIAEHQGQVVLGPFNIDRGDAWQSLQRLAALDVDTACFGHGQPVVGAASAALRRATDPFG
jgi:glyoxylase-like metal-dependent hydrolase (beta-lactamase superfamily II)